MIQERAPHSDLCELLQEKLFQPTEQVLLRIFEQISDAMMCLADNGIIHGDLACRNILVFEFHSDHPEGNFVKLTDFGLTKNSSIYSLIDNSSRSTLNIVPTRYVAPEVLQNNGSNELFGEVGCLFDGCSRVGGVVRWTNPLFFSS